MSFLCPCRIQADLEQQLSFAECCQALIEQTQFPSTAEQLMRSRYTAFTLRNEDYLLATWHESTRPSTLDLPTSSEQRWLDLKILDRNEGEFESYVRFEARSLSVDRVLTLQERSRFIKQEQNWFYVDGDCTLSEIKIGRNQPCPCRSGKKFKRCCLSLPY